MENCSKHGEYESEQLYSHGKLMLAKSCKKCQEEAEEQSAIQAEQKKLARQKQDKKQRFESRMRLANIPDRFNSIGFDEYKVSNFGQKKNLAECKKYAAEFAPGVNLILCGETGTGKTHLAVAIVKAVIAEDNSAMYTRASAMLREVKSTYSSSSNSTEDDIIKKYSSPDLLVIDEIGVQYGSEAEKNIIFEILNERYERVRSTIIVSNLAIEGIEQFIGSRLVDRLREGGGSIVIFNWGSARK